MVPTLSQRTRKDGAPGRLWAAFCRRFAAGVWWRLLRGAEAPVFHGGGGGSARLKVVPFPVCLQFRRSQNQSQRQHQRQERRCRRPWFPPFAKDAKDGAPSSGEGAGQGQNQRQGQRIRSVRSTRATARTTSTSRVALHAFVVPTSRSGKDNINFKSGAAGVRGSHSCAKNAQEWGTLF